MHKKWRHSDLNGFDIKMIVKSNAIGKKIKSRGRIYQLEQFMVSSILPKNEQNVLRILSWVHFKFAFEIVWPLITTAKPVQFFLSWIGLD